MDTWTEIYTDGDGIIRCSRCRHARPVQPDNIGDGNLRTGDANLDPRAGGELAVPKTQPTGQKDLLPLPEGGASNTTGTGGPGNAPDAERLTPAEATDNPSQFINQLANTIPGLSNMVQDLQVLMTPPMWDIWIKWTSAKAALANQSWWEYLKNRYTVDAWRKIREDYEAGRRRRMKLGQNGTYMFTDEETGQKTLYNGGQGDYRNPGNLGEDYRSNKRKHYATINPKDINL